MFIQGALNTSATAELVERSQSGDKNAFGALVERFQGMVFSVAMSIIKNRATAEDISQDVHLVAYQRLEQLENPKAFPGWLRSIALRTALNALVRTKSCQSLNSTEFRLAETRYPEPLETIIAQERATIVQDRLLELPQLDSEALRLFYLEGKSLNEIVEIIEAPLGTVKRRLHVARKRLAERACQAA